MRALTTATNALLIRGGLKFVDVIEAIGPIGKMGVTVDQPRQQRGSRQVDDLGSLGNLGVGLWPHRANAAAVDDDRDRLAVMIASAVE